MNYIKKHRGIQSKGFERLAQVFGEKKAIDIQSPSEDEMIGAGDWANKPSIYDYDRYAHLDKLKEFLDDSTILDELVRAMSDEEADENFGYVLQMNDIPFDSSNNWGVDSRFEMVDVLAEVMDSEQILDQITQAMSNDEAKENFEHIEQMHDLGSMEASKKKAFDDEDDWDDEDEDALPHSDPDPETQGLLGQIDEFTKAYLDAMFWVGTDNWGPSGSETGGSPLEDNYDFEDLSPISLKGIMEDCADFQQANQEILERAEDKYDYDMWSQAGHDFYLTRNGHGAGFWDRGIGEEGKLLTEAARPYGSTFDHVGDDGHVYSV